MPSLIHTLKEVLRRTGLLVARAHHAGARYLEDPPETAFDSTLLRLFPRLQGLRFIQIGANDGVQADPIRRYVVKYRWTGLMVEPLTVNFRELERNCSGLVGVRCLQAAVDSSVGRRLVYDLQSDLEGLPAWARGLGSFDLERLRQVVRELGIEESAIVSEEVETITWREVWSEFGSGRCDVLTIDTEGQDIRLLRLAGIAVRRPRLVHFEHSCCAVDERLEFYRELLLLGYEIATQGGDTVAYLPVRVSEEP